MCESQSGVPRPFCRTSWIQAMIAPPSRAPSTPTPISGITSTTASTSVSAAAAPVRPMPRRASVWRSGQVAIASTQAQASAGRKRHRIHTAAAATAMISADRAIRCRSHSVLAMTVTPVFFAHDLFRKLVPTPYRVRGRLFRDHALSAAAIAGNTLVGQPDAARRAARLPEYVDRHAAARKEIAADTQIARPQHVDQSLADRDGAILVEIAVVAEADEVELERHRFDEPARRHIVDDDDGEIRLARDRAQGGEFGKREARNIRTAGVRVAHAVELCLPRGGRERRRAAELERFAGHRPVSIRSLMGIFPSQ